MYIMGVEYLYIRKKKIDGKVIVLLDVRYLIVKSRLFDKMCFKGMVNGQFLRSIK